MKYIIHYVRVIRIGQYVFEYVGPFPNISAAQEWDRKLREDAYPSKMYIPQATYEPIYSEGE